MNLKQMLAEVLARKASDLHLRVGVKPTIRVDGALLSLECENLTPVDMDEVMNQILTEEQKERFLKKN
ncbi:MAG: type IV pili twitching motility protein PilT, partial [candidate division Zixibacteria bacterium]|nr:type IV pili twitching motility protein PilT [candidate division Zixibacteria bacterium]